MEMVKSGYLVPYGNIAEIRKYLKDMQCDFEMSFKSDGAYFNVEFSNDLEKAIIDVIVEGMIS